MRLDEAARAYLSWGVTGKAVPFLHQGRNPDVGIDCVGLCVLALRACGWCGGDVTSYGRDPHDGLLESHLVRVLGPSRPRGDLQPGDVVSIDFKGATRHVAIVGDHLEGGLSLIHTSSSVGRVTEHRLDDKWQRRITGIYRMGAA